MGLLGILVALGLLIWLAYRGWSVLLLAPAAAILAPGSERSRCAGLKWKPGPIEIKREASDTAIARKHLNFKQSAMPQA
jgi:hypothetical protein